MENNLTVGKLFVDLQKSQTFLTEEDQNTGEMYLSGIFAQADVLNNNKRVYPESVLDEAIEEFNKEMVYTNSAVSELGHPDSPQINLDKVCCKIDSLYKEGKNWMGRAKVLPTPCGQILRGLIQGGVRSGVSTRGLGSANSSQFEEEDCNMVETFHLRAIDVVHSPSGPDCYVDAITEAKDWVLDQSTGKIYELNEETYKIFEKDLQKLPVKKKYQEEQVFGAIKNFLESLKSNPK